MRPTGVLTRFSDAVDDFIGRPWTMVLAAATFGFWFAISIRFEEQQIPLINVLTLFTFLLLFPLQHSENRHARSLHEKLDRILERLEGDPDVGAPRDRAG